MFEEVIPFNGIKVHFRPNEPLSNMLALCIGLTHKMVKMTAW